MVRNYVRKGDGKGRKSEGQKHAQDIAAMFGWTSCDPKSQGKPSIGESFAPCMSISKMQHSIPFSFILLAVTRHWVCARCTCSTRIRSSRACCLWQVTTAPCWKISYRVTLRRWPTFWNSFCSYRAVLPCRVSGHVHCGAWARAYSNRGTSPEHCCC